MKIQKMLIVSLVLLCSCGERETPSINSSGVSQIHAGGNFTFLIKDAGKPLSIGSGSGNTTSNELWLKNDSTGEERLLVRCKDDKKMKNEICDIQNPLFSIDKTEVFFVSSAWVVSGAIHAVNLRAGKERYVCPGNSLQVIQTGKYKGNLLVNKHKYHGEPNYGSYDHYFVVDERGKELQDLGEEMDESKLK